MLLIKMLPITPTLDFMGKRRLFLIFSAALVLGSILLFLVKGLNLGVDFRGGTLIEVETTEGVTIGELRDSLSGLGLGEVTLQEFGDPQVILINLAQQPGDEKEQIQAINQVKEVLGDRVVEYRRTEFVGPKVGAELKRDGALATIFALLGIGAYIWFRFEWQFSLAAMVALAHDIIATIGFYALTQVEFNLPTLAAVLTVAGYSINDTVVIFDRVREMLRKYKKLAVVDLLNQSINRTLSRTLLTSITTLLALGSLFLFGGEVIRGFTMGLIWGVLIGTYSSIGLAVPILSFLDLRSAAQGPGKEATPAPEGA